MPELVVESEIVIVPLLSENKDPPVPRLLRGSRSPNTTECKWHRNKIFKLPHSTKQQLISDAAQRRGNINNNVFTDSAQMRRKWVPLSGLILSPSISPPLCSYIPCIWRSSRISSNRVYVLPLYKLWLCHLHAAKST